MPISGRPNQFWLGAFTKPSTSCSTACNHETLADSLAA
ncbi:hypothetical protein MPS_4102 [Mycobacterium pseudoshottsii JCM 15466]|nr:hypothetical protein MPS_4102 [Mycobacterium pseudoshottsii JCM 15466]